MGLRINTNVAAIRAQNSLSKTNNELSKSFEKLSSGNRISSAADDAAGLSISENLKSQIRSTNQAGRNAQDGISFVQVAEGSLSEVGNILIRMRELSIQAASDTIGDRERGFIDKEHQALKQEVTRIAQSTQFNGINLLNGEGKSELEFQVGTSNTVNDRIVLQTQQFNSTADSLGIDGISSQTVDGARESLEVIDNAIVKVSGQRAELGAAQNKLQIATNTLAVSSENLSSARSRIADTDIAEEMSQMTKKNILQSAGISVLAQANSSQASALKLI